MPPLSLIALGWDDRRQALVADLPLDHVAGRVTRVDRGRCLVGTAGGTYHPHVNEPVAVGDWVVLAPDGTVAAIETDPSFRKIFNILADKPETVAAYFVSEMLKNTRNNRQIAWLTGSKAAWRFMTAPFRKGRLV